MIGPRLLVLALLKWLIPLAGLVVGVAVVLGGFVYDLLLAGIPYPDPTPAQQADWVFHGYVAMMIELLGLSIFLVSLIGLFSIGAHAAWRRQRRRGEVDSASEG
ncbi:MAG: hypothetical protein R3B96_20720 [Pirellulaceae bacterium]